jgi:hypothetical protein
MCSVFIAYNLLATSTSVYPYGNYINNILKKKRFIAIYNKTQFFGDATIYFAKK